MHTTTQAQTCDQGALEIQPVTPDASTDGKLKVMHTAETALGGVGSYIEFLCSATSEMNNIALLPESKTQLVKTTKQIFLFPRKRRGLKAVFAHCRSVMRLYKQEQPDIVFFHSTFSLVPLMMLRVLRPRAKTIFCAHGWAVSQYELKSAFIARIVALVEGTLAGCANRTINISQHDMTLAKTRGYRGHHRLVENAVPDLPAQMAPMDQGFDPKKLNLLFVGRHDTQKGLDILLDAFAEVYKTRKDIDLYVVGASVRTGETTTSQQAGVIYSGWVNPEDIDSWYASADAIIVPSRWEGFGLVVAEAMRNGTPALVSNRGALPDLVEPGKTGDVFDLTTKALAEMLEKCRKSDLRAQREACREVYQKRFSIDRFGKAMSRIYAEITTDE